METEIKNGILHVVTPDIEKVLTSNKKVLEHWNNLTPIARNEWICWVTIVKKDETRIDHLKRMKQEMLEGAKRPCCWPGCPHRNTKSAKWF